ncbi:MAG TPA: OmpA family protein, partial [Propylenella sp.]|nr:OmpA family protein [Propylenella sp.]
EDGGPPAAQQQVEVDDDDDDDGRDIRRGQRWRGGGVVIDRRGDRVIIQEGDQIFVQPVVPDEGERLLYGARDVEVEELQGGFTRTIVYRDNGSEIVTIRDPAGNVVRRIRRTPDGREIVLIDNRFEVGQAPPPPEIIVLPRPVIRIPEERYIVDIGRASRQQLQEALMAPPVQEIERPYTLEEVTRSESLRSYMPRIDLDTITFDFGSATISSNQMEALAQLGLAMEAVIAENPDEVYLIEGHTDAVGSDYDNLILSDRRAEAVAVALSQNFDIPPENLVTEGYGEQYLKVPTEGPSRENRRVAVRPITPLLQTSEAAQ